MPRPALALLLRLCHERLTWTSLRPPLARKLRLSSTDAFTTAAICDRMTCSRHPHHHKQQHGWAVGVVAGARCSGRKSVGGGHSPPEGLRVRRRSTLAGPAGACTCSTRLQRMAANSTKHARHRRTAVSQHQHTPPCRRCCLHCMQRTLEAPATLLAQVVTGIRGTPKDHDVPQHIHLCTAGVAAGTKQTRVSSESVNK